MYLKLNGDNHLYTVPSIQGFVKLANMKRARTDCVRRALHDSCSEVSAKVGFLAMLFFSKSQLISIDNGLC